MDNEQADNRHSENEPIAEQLVHLQTRLTFQEDLIQSLNDTVARQDRELYLMNQKLQALSGLLHDVSGTVAEMKADQPPPHY